MKFCISRSLNRLPLFAALMLISVLGLAQKVATQAPTKPINLDRELEEQVTPNRSISYYHYSLAKWNEDQGDYPKALSELQVALKYNPNSSAVHLAMATLRALQID